MDLQSCRQRAAALGRQRRGLTRGDRGAKGSSRFRAGGSRGSSSRQCMQNGRRHLCSSMPAATARSHWMVLQQQNRRRCRLLSSSSHSSSPAPLQMARATPLLGWRSVRSG